MRPYKYNYLNSADEVIEAAEHKEYFDEILFRNINPDIWEDEAEARRIFEYFDNRNNSENIVFLTQEPEYLERYFKTYGRLNHDKIMLDFSDYEDFYEGELLSVETHYINDLNNGGYMKKGEYSYENMLGRILAIRYKTTNDEERVINIQIETPMLKHNGFISYDQSKYTDVGYLSRYRFYRLAPERNNGYGIVKNATDRYIAEHPGLTTSQTIYQILNVITQSKYKERPYFTDVEPEEAIDSLLKSLNNIEQAIRKNFPQIANTMNEYFIGKNGFNKEKTDLHDSLYQNVTVYAKKEIDNIVGKFIQGSDERVLDTYRYTTDTICQFILDIASDEISKMLDTPFKYNQIPCLDTFDDGNIEQFKNIVYIDKNHEDTLNLVQSVYAVHSRNISRDMAENIIKGVKSANLDAPEYNGWSYYLPSTAMVKPLQAIASNNLLTKEEKNELQTAYVKSHIILYWASTQDYEFDAKEIRNARSAAEIRSITDTLANITEYVKKNAAEPDAVLKNPYNMTLVYSMYSNDEIPDIEEKLNLLLKYTDQPPKVFEALLNEFHEDFINCENIDNFRNKQYFKALHQNSQQSGKETKSLKNPMEEINKGKNKAKEEAKNTEDKDGHLKYSPFSDIKL